MDAKDNNPMPSESIWSMWFGAYRGRLGWLAAVVTVEIFVCLAMAVAVAVRFFAAETTRGMILYATLFNVLVLFIVVLKLWFWQWMLRTQTLDRLDRIEQRLEALAGRERQ